MLEAIDVLEALLFASDTPVEIDRIQEVLDLESPAATRELIEAFRQRLEGRALQVVEAGGGFRLVTRPELAPWLVKLQRSKTRSRLSRPALETLAIVAYHQPVSRPQVDAIRGVSSEGVLDSLLDRRMVKIAGRKESPGRPFLYETTREFLVAFGLRDLGDLPKVEGELQMPALAEGEAGPLASDGAEDAVPGPDERAIAGDEPVAGGDGGPEDRESAMTGEAPPDAPEAPAAFETAMAVEDGRAAVEAPSESGERSTAANPPQQDPGPGGPDVTPRS